MGILSPKPTLNPALREFWTRPARNRVLHGGRASTKSWDAAGFATFLAGKYKLCILCVRQFQNKIEESVYTLLKTQIERFGLPPWPKGRVVEVDIQLAFSFKRRCTSNVFFD